MTMKQYVAEIRALAPELVEGIECPRNTDCVCAYGTARPDEIWQARDEGLSASDYVVRARYDRARAKADRNY